MRGDFLKYKALFMTIVIITAIFTVYNFNLVAAEDTTNYCCEVTKDGEQCIYTSYDECNLDDPYLAAATTCEQTTYCEGGCCVSNQGKCSKNVPKTVCENTEDYTWYDDVDCNIAQCEKQCCTIADSICSYTTSAHCETINAEYPEVDAEFVNVDDEYACSDLCTLSDKGCCVSSDSCTYDTKGMCETPEINLADGTGFYKDQYCSDLNLCGCDSHKSAECVDGKVFWFDSCGNQESIVEEGDINSAGDVYTADGKEVDGDCDYTQGTWCGYNKAGEAYCKDINCNTKSTNPNGANMYTFDGNYYTQYDSSNEIQDAIDHEDETGDLINVNQHDGRIGGERLHGESWCLYEGPAGDFLDRPGSQHYRSYCYFGEEIIESCRDFREEVCIQYPYDPNAQQGITGNIDPTGSACIDNSIYDSPLNSNITTVPKGKTFWSETAETSSCSEASVSCDVTFIKRDRTRNQWECIDNCNCLSEFWMINASKFCSAQGDCGANYNLVEEFSNDAFYVTSSINALKAANDNYNAIAYDYDCADKYNEYAQDPETASLDNLCKPENCMKQSSALVAENTAGGQSSYTSGSEDKCIFFQSLDQTDWYVNSELSSSNSDDQVLLGSDGSTTITKGFTPPNYLYSGKNLKNAYGVHSGLLGISKIMEENLASSAGADALSKLSTKTWIGVGIMGGIAAITFLVATIAAATLTTAATTVTAMQFLTGAAAASGAAGPLGIFLIIAAVVAAALIYIFTSGGGTETVTISSNCETWQAPSGGDYCELCDIPVSQGGLALDDGEGNILPGYECGEYKCKSLGATCEYIQENSGTNREKCYNNAVNDVNSPDIVLKEEIFDDLNYLTSCTNANEDPCYDEFERYVEVKNIQPYTQFSFGIETNELSQCKISDTLVDTYDEMAELFPDSYFSTAHNQTRVLTPNEEFTYYIRCKDPSDNPTIDAYTFIITTNEIDDVQPPIIEATDIASGSYIAEGVNPDVTIFINELVSSCKWSTSDQEYELMENYFLWGNGNPATDYIYTENYRTAELNLTNLGENYFYFACEDNYENINTQNYEYMLIGTEALNIDRTSPNGTLYYNTVTLQVETSIGAEAGKASCSYDGIEFFTTNTSYHEQIFEELGEGDYSHNIKCEDVAGNQNSTTINYTIDIDETAPELTSLYTLSGSLYFGLNEDATCEYHYEEFTFGEGTSTTGTIALTDIPTYYIICEDVFGNDVEFTVEV
jgi:hypothetical protein